MRILIAIGVPRDREAGAAGVVFNHAQELERRGHTVECWFLDDILKNPVRPMRLQQLFFSVAVARRIMDQRHQFDVVNIHAPAGCVYGLWRKIVSAGPLYVLTMQGSEERYARMMKIENRKGRAWHFSFKNRVWHRLYHQTMYDVSVKMADYGAVANREAWIYAELKHNREPGRFWYVPNGVEERFFSVREYCEKPEISLLYVGTWLDRKGVYYLADAFRLLNERGLKCRLTVAGCLLGEEEIKRFFAAEVRAGVTVVPFVKRADMPALYHSHDIFVFPSLVEGMPLTLLEAMAAGMPVVTTNTSGMSDVVEDEVNGLLVQPGNSDKLAQSVAKLWRSADLRKELGSTGQQTMLRYTWGRVTEKLERILTMAVSESQISPKSVSVPKRSPAEGSDSEVRGS